MEKKKYRVKKKKSNKSDVANFTTDSFIDNRVSDVKNLVGSNISAAREKERQEQLASLVSQIPQIMQNGGQPYVDPSKSTYSYVDNTVANISNANQGINNAEQGIYDAFGGIEDVINDYGNQKGYNLPTAKLGDEVGTDISGLSPYQQAIAQKKREEKNAKFKPEPIPINYGQDLVRRIGKPNPVMTDMYPFGSSGEGITPGIDWNAYNAEQERLQGLVDTDASQSVIDESGGIGLSNQVSNFFTQPFYTGVNTAVDEEVGRNDVLTEKQLEEYNNRTENNEVSNVSKEKPKKGTKKSSTTSNQEKVDEVLDDTKKEKEIKSRGNTNQYTEEEDSKGRTPEVEHLQNTVGTPNYGRPMGKFKMKGRDANGKRFKIKYNTMGAPMDMYGNQADVVKGYHGTYADVERAKQHLKETRANRRGQSEDDRLNQDQFHEYENTPTQENSGQSEAEIKRYIDSLPEGTLENMSDVANKFQFGGSSNYSFGQNKNSSFGNGFNPSIGDNFEGSSFEDVGQYQPQQSSPFAVPNQNGFGADNGGGFGQGVGPMGNATSGVDLSMGEQFQPMSFEERQNLQNGEDNGAPISDELNAKSKWKKTGMQADQIADLSLLGVKGLTSLINRNRFDKEKENQYTGADAFASIGNASNMNQGRFDSGNMSGGAFSDRTPIQFAKYGAEMKYQEGGEYDLTEQEIQEIINNGGNVEYL